MRKRKFTVTAAMFALSAILLSEIQMQPAYAVEGWTNDSGEWMYLDKSDQPVTDGWKQSKDSWFYLDSNGKMVRDSFIELGNGLYYADKDGRRAESAWIWSDGREEDGYEDGW